MAKLSDQHILLLNSQGISPLAEVLGSTFSIRLLTDAEQARAENPHDFALALLEAGTQGLPASLETCRFLKSLSGFEDVPIILWISESEKLEMMQVYDAGVDDVLTPSMPVADVVARLQKAVFHTIASRQLKNRLIQANQMAMSAMSDTSDLGVNIQFLVHCHECSNLDELGMLLFRTLSQYNISCSLQMRSEFELKNLEESGLAKDLEARLLFELKDAGRYVDFGRRCVMNYGQVSLLVKNMPQDSRRFGSIKDNVFSLLQGTDARVKSIDGARMLELERDLLQGMSHRMQDVMRQVESRYHFVMKGCASAVEDMAMRVDEAMMFLDLNESQEETFTRIMHSGVSTINRLFNDGVKIDESFRKLLDHLNSSFSMEKQRSADDLRRMLDRL